MNCSVHLLYVFLYVVYTSLTLCKIKIKMNEKLCQYSYFTLIENKFFAVRWEHCCAFVFVFVFCLYNVVHLKITKIYINLFIRLTYQTKCYFGLPTAKFIKIRWVIWKNEILYFIHYNCTYLTFWWSSYGYSQLFVIEIYSLIVFNNSSISLSKNWRFMITE